MTGDGLMAAAAGGGGGGGLAADALPPPPPPFTTDLVRSVGFSSTPLGGATFVVTSLEITFPSSPGFLPSSPPGFLFSTPALLLASTAPLGSDDFLSFTGEAEAATAAFAFSLFLLTFSLRSLAKAAAFSASACFNFSFSSLFQEQSDPVMWYLRASSMGNFLEHPGFGHSM